VLALSLTSADIANPPWKMVEEVLGSLYSQRVPLGQSFSLPSIPFIEQARSSQLFCSILLLCVFLSESFNHSDISLVLLPSVVDCISNCITRYLPFIHTTVISRRQAGRVCFPSYLRYLFVLFASVSIHTVYEYDFLKYHQLIRSRLYSLIAAVSIVRCQKKFLSYFPVLT